MINRLITDQRTLVVAILIALLSLMVLLWFVRGVEPDWSNVVFFAVSMLLIPLAYFAVYGILYLSVRVSRISDRALRGACGVLFVGGATFLSGSALFAVYDFATHRSQPSPSLLAFGVTLGAMKAWGLQATSVSR